MTSYLVHFQLLWIIVIASCAALLIQSLAANLGVVTGKRFALLNSLKYPAMFGKQDGK